MDEIGGGLHNYIAYGDYPMGNYGELSTYKSPRGIVVGRDLSKVVEFDPWAMDGLLEFVNNSWYSYTQGKDVGLHPSVGETHLNYTGATPPYEYLDRDQPYSWIKTPRYKGMPMETGPLARNIVGHASGNEAYKEITQRCLKQLNVPYEAMYSTAGRTLARAIEANLLADWQTEFYTALLQNIKNGDYRMFNGIKWEPDTWPEAAQGVGLTEAPRGALAHYVGIKDKKSSITKWSFLLHGTPLLATPKDNIRLSRPPLSGLRSSIPDCRSKSYAPYTRSTPVWHVPYIYMTKTVNTYTDVKCYNINPKQLNI